jgi:hypothetical protein
LRCDPVEAPIAIGAKLGALVYRYGNYVSKEYALRAHEPVQRDNPFAVFAAKIGFFLSSCVSSWQKKSDAKKHGEPIGVPQSVPKGATGTP